MADWLTVAKSLPAGGRRKIPHCGSDKTMNVWNGPKGYSAFCHRCNDTKFQAHGNFSISMIARRRAELEEVQSSDYRLPSDYSLDVPASEAVWYYKAGIGPELARTLRFGYSQKLQRVIIPIGDAGEWIGRSVHGKPKYIQKVREESIYLRYGPVAYAVDGFSNPLGISAAICEDVLSAIRVSRYVHGISILGTSLNPYAVSQISAFKRVAVWLDPDKAGRKGASKALRRLALQGVELVYIKSHKDPKNLTNEEIRSHLAGYQSPSNDASQEGLQSALSIDLSGDS